ncbi:family 16 glycosylhydrolase [Shewanella donghaensis]|uniref:family 16 glycosylhydrolase n=1 Tax=Shewanella donghaensis TaxID=238836 RepID=UPI0011837949|nr:family 16 glycosylhydrolase [Shewanella donghaensis]
MKKLNKLIFTACGVVSILSLQTFAAAPVAPPIAKQNETWVLQVKRSDEFNNKDSAKWNFQPENFGVWSWRDSNAVVAAGKLTLTTRRENHTRTFWDGCNKKQVPNFPLYYTSGIAKSRATGNYGYYEARIKGANTYPGVSPAFWMYSTIDRSLTEDGDVQYSEIDVVELTQKNEVRKSDHDLHNIVVINGTPTWQRPLQVPFNHNQIILPYDPRNDFHTYGVNVTKDTITWYVDGQEIGSKQNKYWHRQMNLTLSQGLRAPLTEFRCNQFYPSPQRPANGYPTSMEIDYVRTWFKTGGNSGTEPTEPSEPGDGGSCPTSWVPVTGVTVTPSSKVMTRNQTLTLNTTVSPLCATNQKVTYSSSDASIAKVSSSGIVTARSRGNAIITVKTKNKGKVDTVNITVN